MTRWIHGISKDLLTSAFSDYFGVSQEHSVIIVALYGRPGEWTSLRRLQVLLDSHRPPKRQAVYERIRVLREAMEPESLLSGGQLNELGEGYALSEVGYAECAKALRALVDVLLRSGPQVSIPPSGSDLPSPLSGLSIEGLSEAIGELNSARPRPAVIAEPDEGEPGTRHRLISPKEFAARAMFSPGYLRRMSRDGKAPRPVRIGFKVAYLEYEVEEWLATLPRADDGSAPLRTSRKAAS